VENFTLWFSGFRFAFFYPLSAVRYPLPAAPPIFDWVESVKIREIRGLNPAIKNIYIN